MIILSVSITGENFNDTASYKQYGKGLSLLRRLAEGQCEYLRKTPLALLKTETVGAIWN
jgi:hypothetical protein